jgi:hypothetical protein
MYDLYVFQFIFQDGDSNSEKLVHLGTFDSLDKIYDIKDNIVKFENDFEDYWELDDEDSDCESIRDDTYCVFYITRKEMNTFSNIELFESDWGSRGKAIIDKENIVLESRGSKEFVSKLEEIVSK